MRPLFVPLFETLGRRALAQRGARSRWVETQHGKMHVYDGKGQGSLPPIVLLHGLSSSATAFGPILARLLRHSKRVVAPDYPGHGFSPSEARVTPATLFASVAEVLRSLDVEPAVLVGNSLGGAVALRTAIDDAARVRGLVLVSPAGAHASEADWDAIRRTFDVRSRREAKVFLDRLYYRRPWFAPLIAHEMPSLLSSPAVRALLASAANENLPSPDELARLEMPILLLWGRGERLLPEANLDYFTRHLPRHAVIERPEGYAHCPHFDDPAGLTRRIVAFAREVGG